MKEQSIFNDFSQIVNIINIKWEWGLNNINTLLVRNSKTIQFSHVVIPPNHRKTKIS